MKTKRPSSKTRNGSQHNGDHCEIQFQSGGVAHLALRTWTTSSKEFSRRGQREQQEAFVKLTCRFFFGGAYNDEIHMSKGGMRERMRDEYSEEI